MTALEHKIKPDMPPFYSFNKRDVSQWGNLDEYLFTASQSQTPLELYPTDIDPVVLSKIYQPEVRLACWQRSPNANSMIYVHWLISRGHLLPTRLVVAPEALTEALEQKLPNHPHRESFIEDVVYLADMFACLFDMEEVGVRLSLLKEAMCPRFHVDRIGARMVSTYAGEGTEWLPDEIVDRSKLGRGNGGLSDQDSGLYPSESGLSPICQLSAGDVAVMKGDLWPEEEGRGVVHRSPECSELQPRLFLSMDVM